MSPVTRATIAFAAVAALSPLAAADTLLHRQPPGRTFGISSDTEYLDDFNRPTGALIADKFMLAEGGAACRVNAWALYGGTNPILDPPPPATETIRVRFYADATGLPGDVLYEESFVNPPRSWTGMYVALSPLRKEYLFDLSLASCFQVEAGVGYWLEVAQIGDINSLFRWEHSNTAGGFAVQFPLGTPWRLSANPSQLAYELWTPEPCSGALLSLGLALCLRHRRARGGPVGSDKLGRSGV
jgi:hypothetical protein